MEQLHYIQKALFSLLIALLGFSIARFAFLLQNSPVFSDATFSDLLQVFFHGLRFDASALVYVNALVLLSFIIPFPFRNKAWYQYLQLFLFVFCNATALLIEYIDAGFYKYAFRRSILSDVLMMGNNSDNFGQYLKEYWVLLIVLISSWIGLFYFFKKLVLDLSAPKKTSFWRQGILGLVAFLGFGILARGGLQKRPLAPSAAAKYAASNAQAHLMANTTLNYIFSIQQRSIQEVHYFTDEQCKALFSTLKTPSKAEFFTKKNIVILVLESFGKEVFSSFNEFKGNAPFMDSLLNESYSLANSFANGLRSTQGIAAISAGIPSLMADPFVFSAYQTNEVQGLAAILSKEGYQTTFYHGSNEGSMEFEQFAKQAGFDEFKDRRHYGMDRDYDGSWGIWDYPYLEYVAKEIGQTPSPFLAQFFSLTSHHPYEVEQWYKDKYPDLNPVHRATRYTDEALRNFFNQIKDEAWYHNTLFVIAADHVGAAEHPEYATKVGRYKIPIFLYTPDGSLKGKQPGVTQQIDILPTVLDYLNYPKAYHCFGKSLLDSTNNNIAYQFSENLYQIINDDYLLLFDGQQATGLFAYQTDIALAHNLLLENQALANRMIAQLKAIIQTHHKAIVNNQLVDFGTE